MNMRYCLVLLISLALTSPVWAENEAHWPSFQGNQAHTGWVKRTPIIHPTIAWATHVGLLSADNVPLIANNRVLIASSGRVANRWDPPLSSKKALTITHIYNPFREPSDETESNTESDYSDSENNVSDCLPTDCSRPDSSETEEEVSETSDWSDKAARLRGDGIYALDFDTGQPLWFTPLPGEPNGLAYSHKYLVFTMGGGIDHDYYGSEISGFGVISADTGEILWQVIYPMLTASGINGHPPPHYQEFYQPIIVEDTVIVGSSTGIVSAFDLKQGQKKWALELPGSTRAAPAWDGQQLYVASSYGYVTAINLQGEKQWEQVITHPYPSASQRTDQFPVQFVAAPTVIDGTLYLSFARNTFYPHPAMVALDTATGNTRWWAQDPQQLLPQHSNLRTSPAVWGDYLVVGTTYTPTALQINRHTGILEAVLPMGYPTIPQWPSPAINDNQLILPRHDGYVYAWDLEHKKLHWKMFLGYPEEAGETTPVTSESAGWMPDYGDAIYTSPAIGSDGSIIVGANGYLYRIHQSPTATHGNRPKQP